MQRVMRVHAIPYALPADLWFAAMNIDRSGPAGYFQAYFEAKSQSLLAIVPQFLNYGILKILFAF